MSGTVNISRALFSSEAFRDEVFTEREAWVWLVMEASWKDRTVRAGDYVVETRRGQLAASVRFMAKAWGWTAAKAQRFLSRLQKLEMIQSKTDTGVTVVTICNYEKYQNGGKAADTDPIQDRYRTDTNEKKDSIPDERIEKEPSVPFSDFWKVWPNKSAKAAAEKAWKKLSPSDQRLAIGGAISWFAKWRASHPTASPIHPASYLNSKRWTDEFQASFTAIHGGLNEQSASKSESRLNAFVSGARGAS